MTCHSIHGQSRRTRLISNFICAVILLAAQWEFSAEERKQELREAVGVVFSEPPAREALQRVAETGALWVAFPVRWADERPDASLRVVAQAQALGLRVQVILGFGHPRYTGGPRVAPRTTKELIAFGQFAARAFQTLRRSAARYMVWDYPDARWAFQQVPSESAYRAVLNAVLREAKAVGLQRIVATGALKTDGQIWKKLREREILRELFYISLLPPSSRAPEALGEWFLRWKGALKNRKLPARLQVMGLRSPLRGNKQETEMLRALLVLYAAGAEVVLWDPANDQPADRSPDFFFHGWWDAEGKPKPFVRRLANVLRFLEGASLEAGILRRAGLCTLTFRKGERKIWVSWSPQGTEFFRVPVEGRFLAYTDAGKEVLQVGERVLAVRAQDGLVFVEALEG